MKWILPFLVAAATGSPQDWADAPYSWARFKPGTSRTVRMTMLGAATDYHLTLKEVTGKEVVFDVVTTSVASKERKSSVLRQAHFRLGAEKVAEETLEFKGAKYACKVKVANYENAGVKIEGRYWIAEGVDIPLKTVETGKGDQAWMNIETESLLVSRDEVLTIAGRKLKCAKYEGKSKGAQNGTISIWYCDEIPGGLARSESETGAEGAKMKMVMETVEFEVKK